MANINGLMMDTDDAFAVRMNIRAAIIPEETDVIGIRERYESVHFSRLFWDEEAPTDKQATRQSVVYRGMVESEEDPIGYRASMMYKGINVDVGEDIVFGVRQPMVASVILERLFAWDSSAEVSKHGVRPINTYSGFIPWGDGSIPPRRYPLETSWRTTRR